MHIFCLFLFATQFKKANMKKIIDVVGLIAIFIFAGAISTIGLTVKANQQKQKTQADMVVTVYKKEIPILSSTKGIIKKIHIRPGQEVRRGDTLVEIDNPLLKGKIDALQNYPDNLSAQTEAEVAKIELNYLTVTSPVDGVVSEIDVVDGAPVQDLGLLMTMYSNEDITLATDVYTDQYLQIKQYAQISAYDARLDQTFILTPSVLKPEISTPEITDKKKIGLYFNLANKGDSASLLQNEDLELKLPQDEKKSQKPVDHIINFWNSILFSEE